MPHYSLFQVNKMTQQSSLADITFLVDANNVIVSYYTPNEALLFTQPKHFLGKKFTNVIPENEAALFLKMTEEVRAKKQSVSFGYDLTLPDGIHHFVSEYQPCINQLGEIAHVLILIKNITAQKEQERIYNDTRERFKRIFEMAYSGIAFSNVKGDILEVNDAFCNLLENTAGNIKKQNFAEFTHPDDLPKELALIDELYAEKRNQYRLTKRYITPDKKIKWIDITVSAIRDTKNEPMFLVAIVNDISDSIQVKNELNQLNRAKDKLLSIIAHDLRSPLSGIIGLINIYQQDNTDDPQLKNHLVSMMDESAKTALELLENLLNWGNTQTNVLRINPQYTDVNALVKQSIALMKNSANAKMLTLEMSSTENVFANIDRDMMLSVVRNLLSNAIKFTPRGGTISCKTGKNINECWIEIIDSGIGMSEEAIANLFIISTNDHRTGTQNEKGSGLGLLICNDFVNKHNGHIEVTSKPSMGSTFRVIIPLGL